VPVTFKIPVPAKDAQRCRARWGSTLLADSRHLRDTGRPLAIDIALQRDRTAPILSAKQDKDYEKSDYKCRDRVHIPGAVPMKRSNLIVVNGHNIGISDNIFILFLHLLLELKKKKGGWSIYRP